MTDEIYIDRDNMVRRMNEVVALAEEIDTALNAMPPAADGGSASALIGFIAAAGAEGANEYSGAVRLIGGITEEVLDDALASESQMSDELGRMADELED